MSKQHIGVYIAGLLAATGLAFAALNAPKHTPTKQVHCETYPMQDGGLGRRISATTPNHTTTYTDIGLHGIDTVTQSYTPTNSTSGKFVLVIGSQDTIRSIWPSLALNRQREQALEYQRQFDELSKRCPEQIW